MVLWVEMLSVVEMRLIAPTEAVAPTALPKLSDLYALIVKLLALSMVACTLIESVTEVIFTAPTAAFSPILPPK